MEREKSAHPQQQTEARARAPERTSFLVHIAILAAVYFVVGKWGLKLAFVHASATAVWPPTGLSLTTLLIGGYRLWPGILVGAFFVNITTAGSLATSLVIAIGNTLEAVLGAYLVNRFAGGRAAFNRPQDVFRFAGLAGLLSTTVAATCGVTSLVWGGYAAPETYGPMWLTWWLGDGVSNLVLTPLLITWREWWIRPPKPWTRTHLLEAAVCAFVLTLISVSVFCGTGPSAMRMYPLSFASIPPMVWIAFRFSQREAALATVFISGVAIWGTLHHVGPFVTTSPNESLLILQGFMACVAVTTQVLAAVVSERTRAQDELRKSRDELERRVHERTAALVNASKEIEDLYHGAPCGYHSLNEDGMFVRINDTELRWLGYSRQEVVGTLKWTDVITPEGVALFRTIFPMFKKRGWVRDIEYTLVRKDGTQLPVLLSATSVTDAEGRFLMSRSVVYDLTTRRHAEEERNRIFNLSLDLLCIEGFDGYFKQLNPQWERTLGFSMQELCSRPYLEFVHPNDRASTEAEARKLLAGQVTATFENRYLCKDGSYKWFLWNAVPLPEHRLIYAAARDITERKRVEHELQRAHLDLQKSHEELKAAQLQLIQTAKLESVGRLAAGVAHEVKNPLAIILQGVDYLSKRLGNREEDTLTVLRYTADAVRRADAVIKGLLDFSTTRELTLTMESLATVLERVFLLVKHELDVAHVTVVKLFHEPLPPLRIDRNKIEQVFVNLFLNAIQAMPQGGTLTVKTHVEHFKAAGENGGWKAEDQFRIGDSVVVVEVEDTGPGIAEHALERVFDPFFTTKPTGQGTGLGLTVSKKIIELHGGVIRIRNRARGVGVQVTVALKVEGGDTNGHETHSPG